MSKETILIVDDSSSMRQVINTVLKEEGYEPLQASSGDAGLALLRSKKVDLVLSDWNMPGMNGAEFVRAIRENDKTTPVIMVTAETERSVVMEMMKIGVNGYLIKPFKPESLLGVVKKVFAKS